MCTLLDFEGQKTSDEAYMKCRMSSYEFSTGILSCLSLLSEFPCGLQPQDYPFGFSCTFSISLDGVMLSSTYDISDRRRLRNHAAGKRLQAVKPRPTFHSSIWISTHPFFRQPARLPFSHPSIRLLSIRLYIRPSTRRSFH